ncbi:IMPACT family protein [Urechidicola croceus]|uniref:YigZ family protein n=1 Tax=Urechidicola croceus TaxID=1850246 RepID=A0A1D8PBL0_9FLAO|nr:YigZ family protein [Urechidicola croceus]AOW21950.1 YigZ family protein [Urechidicola croceus]
MSLVDTYRTIDKIFESEVFKDKGSKFIGYAFPVIDEGQIKIYIEELKSKHHKARHWCYAWRLGKENFRFRANDDGEPGNSAGQPIYGQIQSFDLTNVLVVVVRYFGGTKLGVSGLINAYKNAAKDVLEVSKIVVKTIDLHFVILFEYEHLDKVMRIIKDKNLTIVHQKMEMSCEFEISVRKKEVESTLLAFENLRCLTIKEKEG